jgi:hypothetical protein
MALTTLQCPSCTAPVKDVGTCPFCNAEIRLENDLNNDSIPDSKPDSKPQSPLPEWAIEARQNLKEGKKLAAIKVIRAGTLLGLKDAKHMAESKGLFDDEQVRLYAETGKDFVHTGKDSPQTANCFPTATRILTPTGHRKMGDIGPGDTVLSTNASGQIVHATVTHKKSYGPSPITRIVLDGESRNLRTTDHHSFKTDSGWKRASQLQPGDTLLRVDDSGESRLVGIHAITTEAPEPVFNLHTTGPHNFIAEGVLAHNFTELRWLRTWAHRLFVDPLHTGTVEGAEAYSCIT